MHRAGRSSRTLLSTASPQSRSFSSNVGRRAGRPLFSSKASCTMWCVAGATASVPASSVLGSNFDYSHCLLRAFSSAPQGFAKEVLTQGDGKIFPRKGQTVTVHYTGTFLDGKVFDSSRKRGQPFQFKIGVGQVIKGWDEGVATMSVGERAKFTVEPSHAYGPRGVPGAIPPNSTLVFDVELISVK